MRRKQEVLVQKGGCLPKRTALTQPWWMRGILQRNEAEMK